MALGQIRTKSGGAATTIGGNIGEDGRNCKNVQTIFQQLYNFKSVNEDDLGKVKGEVIAKVPRNLSKTEVKITKLSEELSNQSKVVTDASTTLEDLLVSIKNLSDNVGRKQSEFSYYKDTKATKFDQDLQNLAIPVLLPEPMNSTPKSINMLSSS